jgi:hypothetical protein
MKPRHKKLALIAVVVASNCIPQAIGTDQQPT